MGLISFEMAKCPSQGMSGLGSKLSYLEVPGT